MKFYLDSWRRIFDYSGVTGRRQYWMTMLWNLLVSFLLFLVITLLGFLHIASFSMEAGQAAQVIMLGFDLYSIPFSLCALSMTVRRLRDAGFTPRKLFWLLIPPVFGLMILVYLCSGTAVPEEKTEII